MFTRLRIVRIDESKPRKSRYRILRTYWGIAQDEYRCHYCTRMILPGDCYSAKVTVMREGGLYVALRHDDPECDELYDDDWEKDYNEHVQEQDKNRATPQPDRKAA